MPDVNSIPFRQASGNGHYESKQLPNDNADFLAILGLPTSIGNVTSASASSLDGQLAAYWGTSGAVIKASGLIGIVDLVDGKVTTKATPAGEIVGTTAIQTLTNKTISNSTFTGTVSGIDKSSVGLGNVDNTSDANKPVSGPQQTALNLKEDKANKGVANGYASLDASVKVPASQLPATIVGSVMYQGGWNALSNSPVMPVATAANKGWYYVVSIAGSTAVDGISDWKVNDWIVSNGNTWNKVDNTDAVTSVAGRIGDVVLTKADVGLSAVDNTSDATKNSDPAVLLNKTISGANNTLTVRLDASDVTGNLPPSHLNGGVGAAPTTFWRGDGQWSAPAGGGDVVGPGGTSVDGEVALFNGASGTVLRRGFGTGLVNVTNGVFQTPISTLSAQYVALPRGYLAGLGLANNATDAVNDIDIAIGDCRDSTNAQNMTLAAPITKRLDANWVVGNNQGGLDTGAIANVTYHVHLIKRADTGVVDALFSASATAPTLPASYTHFRRVGSILRVAGAISLFFQYGDRVLLVAPTNAWNSTIASAKTLISISVPLGIITFPILFSQVVQGTAGTTNVFVYPGSGPTLVGIYNQVRVASQSTNMMIDSIPSSTSAGIYIEVVIASGTLLSNILGVQGWIDTRDR